VTPVGLCGEVGSLAKGLLEAGLWVVARGILGRLVGLDGDMFVIARTSLTEARWVCREQELSFREEVRWIRSV
jgi:hypothetical protein